jgi:hypothetical protein
MAPKARHQPHVVVNLNKKAKTAGMVGGARELKDHQPQVNVSSPYDEGRCVHELDGRLTLVQERAINWKVTAIDQAVDYDLDEINNPINQVGPLHELEVPIVTNNDPVSYRAAVNKRSNFIQDGPDDDIDPKMLDMALGLIGELPNIFAQWEENDYDRERWLAKFDEGKRARMEAAWLEIDQATLRDIRAKTGSVKREVLIGKRFDDSAAGRIIYAGTDAFNALTGPAQMVAMERLVMLLAHTDPLTGQEVMLGDIKVLLGYKAQDTTLASFIKDDRFPAIVEGDFSRNDREQRSRVAIICDAWFAKMGLPEWYRELLFQLEHYELTNYKFGLRVNLSYQLATGTTNTTFRNSVFNMTMFSVVARRQHRKGKALVLGDDLLACLDFRLDLKKWVEDVAAFKMVLKAKAPKLNGEATFLSRRLFVDCPTPFMIPQPEKAYFRFNCRANPNQAISDVQYVAAKALSYAFSFRHSHVFRDIFLRRWEMCGKIMDFDVSEIGWNNRQFGYSVQDILDKTINSENLIEFSALSEWITDVYGSLDICDVEDMFTDMVCSQEVKLIDDERATVFRDLVV